MDYRQTKLFLDSTKYSRIYVEKSKSNQNQECLYSSELLVYRHPIKEVFIVIQDLASEPNTGKLHSIKAYATVAKTSSLVLNEFFSDIVTHSYPNEDECGLLIMSSSTVNPARRFVAFMEKYDHELFDYMSSVPFIDLSLKAAPSTRKQEEMALLLGMEQEKRDFYFKPKPTKFNTSKFVA
ncbi:MAG: hypothetical protein ACRCXZ_02560 [Patescibacteria group bacterium]